MVEGQIDGGTVQGIGGALYEHLAYDEDGNPVATTFVDYLIPTMAEVPVIEHGHIETPDPDPAATRASARVAPSAHHRPSSRGGRRPRPFGVTITRLPLTPRRSSACSTKRPRVAPDPMRIGLYGGAATPDKIIEQAQQAEADGFSALWYASGVQGDPLVAMALAGRDVDHRARHRGAADLPVPSAAAGATPASVAAAMGRPGFTLGVGPSHESNISGIYGLSYDHPGRSTEEYVRILTALLRGEDVEFEGEDWDGAHTGGVVSSPHPVPVLLSALSPRLLRVAGEHADGAVLWMATAAAIEEHIAPRITSAAEAARPSRHHGSSASPLAVHHDGDEARGAVAAGAVVYADRPNYQRIMESGGRADPLTPPSSATKRRSRRNSSPCSASATEVYVYVVPVGRTSGPPGSEPWISYESWPRHERHPRLVGAPDRHRHRWWIRHRPRHQQAPGCRRSGRRRSRPGRRRSAAAASAIEERQGGRSA